MDFNTRYPDFAAVEHHIRRANAERSVYVAHAIGGFVESAVRGFRKIADSLGSGLDAERERNIIASDAFLKRSVPRY